MLYNWKTKKHILNVFTRLLIYEQTNSLKNYVIIEGYILLYPSLCYKERKIYTLHSYINLEICNSLFFILHFLIKLVQMHDHEKRTMTKLSLFPFLVCACRYKFQLVDISICNSKIPTTWNSLKEKLK